MKYDESDNLFIRGSRLITDKVTSLAGKKVLVGSDLLNDLFD